MKSWNDVNPRAHRLFLSFSLNIVEMTFEILIADSVVFPLWTHPTGSDVDLREDEANKEAREEP